MKKILFLGLILTLVFTVSASAQITDNKRIPQQREMQSFRHGDRNRYESRHLNHDEFRYKMARRRAYHDGRFSRHERRHLDRMRRHERYEFHRHRHNRFHRAI
jgi:hypothetical protein